MGPGLIESIYEKCLMRELELEGISAKNQLVVPIEYKGYTFEEPLRLDVLVADCLLLELKSVERVHPIHTFCKTFAVEYFQCLLNFISFVIFCKTLFLY